MYKCLDCGHIFDEGEEKVILDDHGLPGGYYERFEYCPCCGGDFEETVRCENCYGEFLSTELVAGYYCKECLHEMIDFDSFLEFATTGTEEYDMIDTLEDFIFLEIFHVDTPKRSSYDLKRYCRELYLRAVANEKLLKEKEFIGKIYNYLSRGDINNEFAEFLYEKEKMKNENRKARKGDRNFCAVHNG